MHRRPIPPGQNLSRAIAIGCPSLALVLVGCQSPLWPRGQQEDGGRLSPAVTNALAREIATLPADAAAPMQTPASSSIEDALANRREELATIGPQWDRGFTGMDLGPTLSGEPRREVALGLEGAIRKAVENNLNVQVARIDQGITEARLAQAEAAFDATLVASTAFQRTTQPQVGVVLPGGGVLNSVNNVRSWAFSTGIQQPLVTGGALELSTSTTRTSFSPRGQYSPDPAWASAVSLGFAQPILRGFGTDVNMASIRLARNQERAAFEDLREQLLETVFATEDAYWRLAVARQVLVSLNWLVDAGVDVREVLSRRRDFDATLAQYANAVATVESRRSEVLAAQREVNLATNRLKALINDPDFPVGGEVGLVPIDLPVESPISQDLRSAIVTATDRSPSVVRALLGIDSRSIGVTVADNNRLPQLDLEGRLSWFGLDGDFGDSYSDIGSGDFVEYLVGARFSQAIGNRAAEAAFREARLARSRAVLAYRASVQQAVLDVKNALQQLVTNYELIRQNKVFRLAQAENLRALTVSEQTLAGLTPEFLQLKFQLQDALARAQIQVVRSLAEYNIAIASLQRAMGTGLEANRIELEVIDRTGDRDRAGASDRRWGGGTSRPVATSGGD